MSYGRQLKTEVSEAPGPVPRPALHLSFPLVRLGGFAADYFRGHPSALRAAGERPSWSGSAADLLRVSVERSSNRMYSRTEGAGGEAGG